jgi:hypothetical protein
VAAAVAAALVAAPAALPEHTTRPYQQSLEGWKGAGAPPMAVTQRYVLTRPGARRAAAAHASYAGRDHPAPAAAPAPPSPGMIALLTVLALVGAGVLLTAPRWLRGR